MTYTKIQTVLKRLKSKDSSVEISLREISVLSPGDDLIRLLGTAIRTGKGIAGIRFTGNTIDNRYIEDAYIYRLT